MKSVQRIILAVGLFAFSPMAMGQAAVNVTPAPARAVGPSTATNMQMGNVEIQVPGAANDASPIFQAPSATPLRLILAPKLVKTAYLGIGLVTADATIQSQLSLPEGVGLVIKGIVPNGPADLAGLKEYDVIYKLDDQIAISPDQFEVLIRTHKAGDTVELTVIRQAQPLKVTAKLIEMQQPDLMWLHMQRNTSEMHTDDLFPASGNITLQGSNLTVDKPR